MAPIFPQGGHVLVYLPLFLWIKAATLSPRKPLYQQFLNMWPLQTATAKAEMALKGGQLKSERTDFGKSVSSPINGKAWGVSSDSRDWEAESTYWTMRWKLRHLIFTCSSCHYGVIEAARGCASFSIKLRPFVPISNQKIHQLNVFWKSSHVPSTFASLLCCSSMHSATSHTLGSIPNLRQESIPITASCQGVTACTDFSDSLKFKSSSNLPRKGSAGGEGWRGPNCKF